MRNSFNFYPVVYKIIAVIICFLLVLIYNRSKAAVYPAKKATEIKIIQAATTTALKR